MNAAQLSLGRIEAALATPRGWIELAAILAVVVVALALRRALPRRDDEAGRWRLLLEAAARLMFPLTALVALGLARIAYRRWVGAPLFIDVAIPLTGAWAIARAIAYLLQTVFGRARRSLAVSERVAALAVWGGFALHMTGILPELAGALEDVSLRIGAYRTNLLQILSGLLLIVATILLTLWVANVIEQRLAKAETLDTSLRALIAKASRALLLVVASLLALSAVGIDLTVLSVFGGAIGVGIGLGLQKTASNYLAGFSILLDRSIRIGDLVTVNQRTGIVRAVTTRYVVVRSLDGTDAIIPNETMITTTVLNHAYSGPEIQMRVPVAVAYGTDLEVVRRLLLSIGAKHPRVSQHPIPPVVMLARFGDSAIDMELAVWIRDPANGQNNLLSDLNFAIWEAFRDNGITIPFPQREVRLIGTGGVPAATWPTPKQSIPAAAGAEVRGAASPPTLPAA